MTTLVCSGLDEGLGLKDGGGGHRVSSDVGVGHGPGDTLDHGGGGSDQGSGGSGSHRGGGVRGVCSIGVVVVGVIVARVGTKVVVEGVVSISNRYHLRIF